MSATSDYKSDDPTLPPPSSHSSSLHEINRTKNNKEEKDPNKGEAKTEKTKNKTNSSMTTTIQERANSLFCNSEILAPMVRASTTPLRTLALQYGADLVFTEEIIDRSITTCDRIVNKELGTIDYVRKMETFSPKVLRRMKSKDEIPVILRIDPNVERGKLIYQMGTGESDLALPAALMVQQDVDGIDINMGCPKKFSVSGGMGSALLSDAKRAAKIISTLRENLSIPVSAKIRLLKTTQDTIEFVLALVRAGVNALTVHAREVGDESQKPAKWDRLVELVQALKNHDEVNIPIIINGDLYTRKDMIQLKKRCGADGVMLARPALYNTSLFCKPNSNNDNDDDDDDDGEQYSYKSKLLQSKTSVIQDYIKHAVRYKTNSKNVKYVVCEMMNNRRAPTQITPFLPHNFEGNQTIDKVCKTRSLVDLCTVWGVKEENVMTTAVSNGTTAEQPAGEHRYDDRYFLDHDKYRKERSSSNNGREAQEEEKKESNNSKNSHNGEGVKGKNENDDVDCKQTSSLSESAPEKTEMPNNGDNTSSATDSKRKKEYDDDDANKDQSLVDSSFATENASKRPKVQ